MENRLPTSAAFLYSVNALTGYLKSLDHRVSKAFVGDVLDWMQDEIAKD